MNHSLSSCIPPPQMAEACKSFERFYLSRHSGRRLTWQYSLGNAHVNVKFTSKSVELNVATFALVILLLFENVQNDGCLTYSVCFICFIWLIDLWIGSIGNKGGNRNRRV
jgi:cullin 3